jgi:hypothetical protein
MAIMLLQGCSITSKSESVGLPDGRGSVWTSVTMDATFQTTVENSYGSITATSLPIADGRRRTNLYLASSNELVTVEAGGDTSFFDITKGRAPRIIDRALLNLPPSRVRAVRAQEAAASEHWQYLGALAARDGEVRFYTPEELTDCIDLYGEGSTNVRPSRHKEDCAFELSSMRLGGKQ